MKLLELYYRCICVLIALILLSNNLSAQKHRDINLAHNWNFLDRDIEVSVENFSGKLGFSAGLNLFQHTAQDVLYWSRPYAANFGQRIGAHAALLYRIPLRDSDVELVPLFKLGFFYLSEKTQIGENNAETSPAFFRPISALGIQAKAKLSGRLMLFARAEAGFVWDFSGTEEFQLGHRNIPIYGGGAGATLGLAWRLKK